MLFYHSMIGIGLILGWSLLVERILNRFVRHNKLCGPPREQRSLISSLLSRGSYEILGHVIRKGVFDNPMRNLHSDIGSGEWFFSKDLKKTSQKDPRVFEPYIGNAKQLR